MQRLLELAVWLGVISLQIALWPQITEQVLPAFVLAGSLAWGLAGRPGADGAAGMVPGFRLAFASGLILDLYTQHHFGMFTVATSLGYITSWLFLRPPAPEVTLALGLPIALAAAAVYELAILIFINSSTPHFPFFAELLTTATLNVAGTVTAFVLFWAIVNAYLKRFPTRHERSLPN